MSATGGVMVDKVSGDDASAAPGPAPTSSAPTTGELLALSSHRNVAIGVVFLAVVLILVLVLIEGAQVGAWALAVLLACCGLVRIATPGRLLGLSIRSRGVDAIMYFGLAAAITFFAQTAANI